MMQNGYGTLLDIPLGDLVFELAQVSSAEHVSFEDGAQAQTRG
jgi:hypothetical protein